MTEPRLISLIVCAAVNPGPPLALIDPRRRWTKPPGSIWIIADIENPTEQQFSWDVEIWRKDTLVDHLGETLEPVSPPQFVLPTEIAVVGARSLIYSLHWLLNGRDCGKIHVDFGYPEAAP